MVHVRRVGGQAGSSSKIENYLGFPTGISGQELAGRAYTQAQKFGAQVLIAKGATELSCQRKPYAIAIDERARVPARSVHAPWTLGRAERRALCPDYPPPVVDVETARGRALAAYADAVERRRAGRS